MLPVVIVEEHLRLFPTPRSVDATSGPDYAREGRERSGGDDLATFVAKEADVRGKMTGLQLSADFSEWLMGFPYRWSDPSAEEMKREIHLGLTWEPERPVPRVVMNKDQVARRERLRALGNAVVPQIVAWIGERIIEADEKLYPKERGC